MSKQDLTQPNSVHQANSVWQSVLAGKPQEALALMLETARQFPDDKATKNRLTYLRYFLETTKGKSVLDQPLTFLKKVDWSKNLKLRPEHRELAITLETGKPLGEALTAVEHRRFESLYFVTVLIGKGIAAFGNTPKAVDAMAADSVEPIDRNREAVHTGNEKEIFMSKIQEICQGIVNNVDDAIAVGVVDVETGMMMGVHHTVPYFTQTYLDAVAAAAVELFRGKMVRRVEELLSSHRGKEVKDSFQEIFIKSTEVFHFMATIPEKNSVIVLVTRKTTSQGMGWASLRSALGDIRDALP